MIVHVGTVLSLWLLQTSGGGGIGGMLGPLFVPLAILVIFYVLLFMPARNRQKKTQAMLDALKNGDKVITSGGLYGTIVGLEPDAVQLRIGDAAGTAVKVKVARSAISGLQAESKEA